jgi:hypothetical protein
MPTAPIMTIDGLAPTCSGRLDDDPTVHADTTLAARVGDHVAAGREGVLVSLDSLGHATADEVKTLCAFLWTLRMEGANPVVVCGVPDVAGACRALKLDQAFPLEATQEAAHRHLASLGP